MSSLMEAEFVRTAGNFPPQIQCARFQCVMDEWEGLENHSAQR